MTIVFVCLACFPPVSGGSRRAHAVCIRENYFLDHHLSRLEVEEIWFPALRFFIIKWRSWNRKFWSSLATLKLMRIWACKILSWQTLNHEACSASAQNSLPINVTQKHINFALISFPPTNINFQTLKIHCAVAFLTYCFRLLLQKTQHGFYFNFAFWRNNGNHRTPRSWELHL